MVSVIFLKAVGVRTELHDDWHELAHHNIWTTTGTKLHRMQVDNTGRALFTTVAYEVAAAATAAAAEPRSRYFNSELLPGVPTNAGHHWQ